MVDEYDIIIIDVDLVDHLDPDHPFEIDLGGQGHNKT